MVLLPNIGRTLEQLALLQHLLNSSTPARLQVHIRLPS